MGMSITLFTFGDAVIGAMGIREWKYRVPLFVDDTVHVETEIVNKRITSDGECAVVERSLS